MTGTIVFSEATIVASPSSAFANADCVVASFDCWLDASRRFAEPSGALVAHTGASWNQIAALFRGFGDLKHAA